jgi:hypothetical protein
VNSVYKYRILKEKNLIIKYYSGELTLQNLFDCVALTGNDPDYLPTMFVLNDMRDGFIVNKDNDIFDFIDKIKGTHTVYGKRKIVFLTKTPNQVVFSEMLDSFKKETFIEILTTSTIDSALKYLNISEEDYDLVKHVFNDFRIDFPCQP